MHNVAFLVETILADLKKREEQLKTPQRMMLVLDESGQWIEDDQGRLSQLQALVEEAAIRGQGKLWLIVTTHGDMGSIYKEARALEGDMKKIEGRFRFKPALTTENIELVLEDRLFRKRLVGTNITSGSNAHVHNNLFLGCGGPALHAGVSDPAVSTWDYNGYTDSDDVQFKAPGERPARSFRQMQDQFGYEKHRVEVGFDDLVNVPPPQGEAVASSPQDFGDYRLKPGSRAVDAGMLLPNINDDFAGQAPDLGAVESGQPLPHFGPRRPDAAPSR